MDRERPHEESVALEISGCSKEDARIVFDTLCACFESDRGPDEVPQQLHETRPMVWLGTFEVTEAHECPPRPGSRPRSRPTRRAATGRSSGCVRRWTRCSRCATSLGLGRPGAGDARTARKPLTGRADPP